MIAIPKDPLIVDAATVQPGDLKASNVLSRQVGSLTGSWRFYSLHIEAISIEDLAW